MRPSSGSEATQLCDIFGQIPEISFARRPKRQTPRQTEPHYRWRTTDTTSLPPPCASMKEKLYIVTLDTMKEI